MICIKGKIVNKLLSSTINQIAHINFTGIFLEKYPFIIVDTSKRITQDAKESTDEQFLTSYPFDKTR